MRFTIVIPSLNRHDDLRRAIKSCLAQTFTGFEIIVVDDGSAPPLEDVCSEFGDARITCCRNAVNRGVAHSRNAGIDAAAGEYVSFLDSDDVYLPERLEILDQRIRAAGAPPAILFHRQRRLLNPNGASVVMAAQLPARHARIDEYILIGGNFIQTNSFVIRRELAQQIRFDSDCKVYEDTKFLIECWLASKDYIACDEILSVYHDYQGSSRLSRQRRFELLQPMLLFAEQRCSRQAYTGFAAFACAGEPFFRHPQRVLTRLYQAYRAGVPKARCAMYLARSMFGAATADAVINEARLILFRLRRLVCGHCLQRK